MWNSFTDKIIVNDKFNFRRNRRKSGLMACSTTANTKVSMGGGGGGEERDSFQLLTDIKVSVSVTVDLYEKQRNVPC